MQATKFSRIPLLVAASPTADLDVAEELHVLAPFLKLAFGLHGCACVVTHGKDGDHSKASRHDEGYCLDIRLWGLQFGEHITASRQWWKSLAKWCAQLARELNEAAGPYVYLVLEHNHLHLEWAGPGQVPNIKGLAPGRFFYMTDAVRILI